MEGRDPKTVGRKQAAAIAESLKALFGTPDDPKVPPGADLNLGRLVAAAGPDDDETSQRGLFRRHCVTCHGISGDGAGPGAGACVPYFPRDFRPGLFKYTSTRGGAKPVREDLRKTLLRGLSGTSMPSFIRLKPAEIEALIEYVKYLSLRGQTERYLFQAVVDEEEPLPLGLDQILDEAVRPVASLWKEPDEGRVEWVVVPPPRQRAATAEQQADSRAKGRAIYLSERAQCVRCHGEQGDGKGKETELYDDWNKPKIGATPDQTARLAPLFNHPLQKLRPRDFRAGIFHGGAAPEDLYLRIAVGLKGTPMAGTGGAPGIPAVLSPEEIGHVVDFIRGLAAEGGPRKP
jgi:mono/diheme cytochrome c family protein